MRKRILALLLAAIMVLGVMPITIFAESTEAPETTAVNVAPDTKDPTDVPTPQLDTPTVLGKVHVIVENTTYKKAAGAPWEGTLVDKMVDITSESTMMSCVVAALGTYHQTGAENNYITEINGLNAFDGGSESGWMGSLNDWFTNEGFGEFTVANKGLQPGDEIRIMYTCKGYGADLGTSFSNTSTALKGITFSAGVLSKDFDKATLNYTLTVPQGTTSLNIVPTAENKSFQVRVFSSAATADAEKCTADSYKLGTTDLKAFNSGISRTKAVPLASEDETIIKVVCGDPDWPGSSGKTATVYTFIVKQEGSEAKLIETGTDGNIVWSMYDDGKLVLSAAEGSDGTMKDYGFYSSTQAPWVKGYASQIKSVEIQEGVTSIGSYAFCNLKGLENVAIPASMTSFSTKAFYQLNCVKSFTVAQGGAYSVNGNFLMKGTTVVFGAMGSISGAVTIPAGVTELGDFALFTDPDITSVTLPEGLVTIGESAVDGCAALTSINIPSTVRTIRNDAFFNTAITSATVPEGVTAIESNTFYGCAKLESVKLPSTLKSIGKRAFYETTALKGITIPEKVKTLGESTFEGSGITSVTIPEGVTALNTYEFKNCKNLASVTLPSTLESIGQEAFCNDAALKSITIPGSVKTIGSQAFYMSGLTSVVIPDGVTTIDSLAFASCADLETASLPASLTSLAGNAFRNDPKLKTFTIAEGGAFSAESGMIIKSTDTGKEVVSGSLASGDIVIPEGVTAIASSAFSGNETITSVKLPGTLVSIGQNAFNNCKGLTGKLTIPGNVRTIEYSAFGQCIGITEVYMEDQADPDNTSWDTVFRSCTGIKTVRLPANMKKYNSVFSGCTGITELQFPETLTTVESMGSMKLKRLVLPESVTSFEMTSGTIEYLEFKGPVKVSGSTLSMFAEVEVLVLPATLETYANPRSLPKIIGFRGTEEQWKAAASETARNYFESKGGIVICNYDPDKTIAAPVITKQPTNAEVQKYAIHNLTVEHEEKEGYTYKYEWYRKDENGEVKVSSDKKGTVPTGAVGTFTYYCLIKYYGDGSMGECKTNDAVITVTDIENPLVGDGSEANPYLISTAEQLNYIRGLTQYEAESWKDKFFKMTADITLPDDWSPIGCTKDGTKALQSGRNLNAFSGTFDGDGYTLTVPKGGKPLFAYVRGATIKNLKIYGEQIDGYGLINNMEGVGLNEDAVLVDNVTLVSGTKTLKSGITGGEITINGFAGVSAGFVTTIRNCTVEEGCVIGYTGDQTNIGSFAGRFQGTIENCVSHATVKGVNRVGGIIGTRDNAMGYCLVKNCQFDGTVEGTKNVGGIVGGGYENSTAPNGVKVTVENCTSAGTVKGTENVGGILGGDEFVAQAWNDYTFIGNSFTGKVSGTTNVGGIIGFYDSLNKMDNISGNTYNEGCGADKGIGAVKYVDTSYENPTDVEGTLYFSTKDDTSGCPTVKGCGWKKEHNRTDDPLGKDAENLCKMIKKTPDQLAAEAVEEKIDTIGEVTLASAEDITDARKAYDALTDEQKSLVTNLDTLTAAEAKLSELIEDLKNMYKSTGDYIEALGTPVVGSVGGEWMAIGLARSGRDVPDGYYDNVVKYVNENVNDKEQLHKNKSTENSRVILALTAAGYDVTDVDGHNLLEGYTDMAYLKKQGINGPVWALIALDSHDYEIPESSTLTRDAIVQEILNNQLADGGWALSGNKADPDMTAMALQALAPYYKTNADVKTAVDKAVERLSDMQNDNGGYSSWSSANSESCAQVIVALTALGIDPATDARFVKNGRSVVDALADFYVDGGGFKHTADGKLNGMATDQGYYALAAYFRFKENKTALYDMSDVTIKGNVEEYVILEGADITVKAGDSLSIRASGDISKFVELLMDGKTVDSGNYTLKEGSTIVNFNRDYLSSLAAGKHEVTFVYTDGEVSTSLTLLDAADKIKPVDSGKPADSNQTTALDKPADSANPTNNKPAGNPSTDDENNIAMYAALVSGSMICIAALPMVYRKKSRQDNFSK